MSGEEDIDRATILIADDRPSNLKALEGALAQPDYDLVLATSGEEVLASVLRRDFAVLVLDVAMPRLTGFETAEILKQRELSRRIPIIFVTASVYDMEHIYRAYDVGAVDCLRKPVDPYELRSKVSVFVELYRQRRRIERQAVRIRETELRAQRLLLVRAEAALRESEALYEVTFEEAPVGFGQAGPDGRFIRVNERLCEITGRAREGLLGSSVSDVAGAPQAQAIEDGIDQLRSGRRVWAEELEIRQGSLERAWISLTISALRDGVGGVVRFIVVVDDATERRRLEAERARLVTELREGIRARDDFLAIAAHELKTPLTPLRLLTGGLLRELDRRPDGSNPELLKRRLASLDESTGRMETLVDRLLDVTKVSVGRLVLTPEDLDLAALVREVAARFAAETQPRPVITIAPCEAVTGRWDRFRMEQVILNLLSNAAKYGGGKPVEVEVDASGVAARVRVRDQGIGIPEDAQDRIFERFERVAPARHYGGFGLGLWIVRRIVEAHGGAISVRSRPGEGSEFTVEVPLRPPAAAPDVDGAAAASAGDGGEIGS